MKTSPTMRAVADGDSLSEIRNDLEIAIGKLEAFAALLAQLTDDGHGGNLVLFSLQYSAEHIAEEFTGVFDRLRTFETRVQP